ncbi:MAG: preprotein translocase subunit YajC [Ruminococcaceae bacterium]|nr:preprotein translocase subunit YajC [Oscillospiraceae bacterium]
MNYFILSMSADGQPNTLFPAIMMLVFVIVLFFFMSRKQKKEEKALQEMKDSIKIGDEVTTIGGIVGRVVNVKEETIVIETTKDRTKIRFLKSAVKSVDVKAEDAE